MDNLLNEGRFRSDRRLPFLFDLLLIHPFFDILVKNILPLNSDKKRGKAFRITAL